MILPILVLMWLTTPECGDDLARWSPVPDSDLAGYRLSLDTQLLTNLPAQATSYPLGCGFGQVCIRAYDLSGNQGPLSCLDWALDPGKYLDTSDESCAVGEPQPCILWDGPRCLASIAVPPACLTMRAR